MELVLVRHGQPITEVHSDGSFADPRLSEIGTRQAEQVGSWLSRRNPDRIYSSPMARAYQTAEPIAAACGIDAGDICVREHLSEFDRDSSSYVPMEELKKTDRKQWDRLASGSFDPDHQSQVIAWVERAAACVDEIAAENPSRLVVVACHGGIINAYLARCLEFPPEKFLRFDVDYTSVSRIIASSQGHRSVASINERTHLYDHPDLLIGL